MSAWKEDTSVSKFARTVLDHTAVIVQMVLLSMLMGQVVTVRENRKPIDIEFDQTLLLIPFLDINECSDGTHSCRQMCNNIHGSYRCSCHGGYQLNNDGFTCRGQRA